MTLVFGGKHIYMRKRNFAKLQKGNITLLSNFTFQIPDYQNNFINTQESTLYRHSSNINFIEKFF